MAGTVFASRQNASVDPRNDFRTDSSGRLLSLTNLPTWGFPNPCQGGSGVPRRLLYLAALPGHVRHNLLFKERPLRAVALSAILLKSGATSFIESEFLF